MRKTIFLLLTICAMTTLPGCHLFFSDYGEKMTFGACELFYKNGVTAEEAKKLGDYLLSEGFFTEENPNSVQITKKDDIYIFHMVTKNEYFKDDNFAHTAGFMAMDLSTDVFDKNKVNIELADENFETRKEILCPGIRIDRDSAFIYRRFEVDADIADEVTDYLVEIEFIGDRPMVISYGIEGDDFLYELVINEGQELDKAAVNANKTICGLISAKILDNKPIKMNLLASDYSIKSTYTFEDIQLSYMQFIHSMDSTSFE
jgi:hypothetical protein